MDYICINTGDHFTATCNRICVHRSEKSSTGCIQHVYNRTLLPQDVAHLRNTKEPIKKIMERAEAKIILAGKIIDNIHHDKYRRYHFVKSLARAAATQAVDDAEKIAKRPLDYVCNFFKSIDPSLWLDVWNHHYQELRNTGIMTLDESKLMMSLYTHKRSMK